MGAGITKRYPRVKIVTCHLGGALPLLVPRMDDHLASDYPYQQDEQYQHAVTYVEASGLPPADVSAILGGNAQALLGLDAGPA